MSSGLNNETFDGLYQDKLAKRVRREMRDEQKRLVDNVRSEVTSYRERMGSGHIDYMHQIIGKNSLTNIVTLERRVEASGQGLFHYLWLEHLAIADDGRTPPNKVATLNERSYSGSEYHYGFRHERRDGVIHIDPDLLGMRRIATSVLPHALYKEPKPWEYYSTRREFHKRPESDPFKERLTYYGFVPVPDVGMTELEILESMPLLHEVAGVFMSLGPKTAVPKAEIAERFEDRLWQLRKIENAQEASGL